MPQQQQFASVPSPLACPSASQTNASCQPLTDRRPSTNMPRVLDTFLTIVCQAGCARAGLSVHAALLHSLGGGGGGCMGAAGACKKKKRVMKHEMCWDLRACARLRDGWVGWTLDGEDRPSVPCAWQLLAAGAASAVLPGWDGMKDGLALGTCLGVMGRWCCWFRGGGRARGVVRGWGLSFFLSVESRVLTVTAPRDGCTQEKKGTFKD